MSLFKVLPAQGVGHRDLYGDQVVVAAGHVVQRGPRYTNADQIGRPIGYRATGCEAGTHVANHGLGGGVGAVSPHQFICPAHGETRTNWEPSGACLLDFLILKLGHEAALGECL